jgi:hypothetical protein
MMTVLRNVAVAMVLSTLGASPVFALNGGVPAPAVAINVATDGMSIKAAVPAVTTDVRYRAHRDNRYPLDWGYPTYNNYGYPEHSTYSRSWGYPRGGSAVHVVNGGLRGAQASIGSVGVSAADASYCRQRWAYYDAEAGKYMGDDGEWRPCP